MNISRSAKKLALKLFQEGGADFNGLLKTTSKYEDSPILAAMKTCLQSHFPDTEVSKIYHNGDQWTVNLQAPLPSVIMITGLDRREEAKTVAYKHRDVLQSELSKAFNVTPLSVGGLRTNGLNAIFIINFTLRNNPVYEILENESENITREELIKKLLHS